MANIQLKSILSQYHEALHQAEGLVREEIMAMVKRCQDHCLRLADNDCFITFIFPSYTFGDVAEVINDISLTKDGQDILITSVDSGADARGKECGIEELIGLYEYLLKEVYVKCYLFTIPPYEGNTDGYVLSLASPYELSEEQVVEYFQCLSEDFGIDDVDYRNVKPIVREVVGDEFDKYIELASVYFQD